jgi:hypothetical protein
MKKQTIKIPNEADDDLRPHYDFDYSKAKPNRFAGHVTLTHGGQRPHSGRKPSPVPIVRKTITLTKPHLAFLSKLDANISRAIRKLIENSKPSKS